MTKQQNDCAPSEDSDQHGHPPSLIRVFAVCMKKAWVPSYPLSAQWRLWSDWADAQADLSFCWAHCHFVGFVMRWLHSFNEINTFFKMDLTEKVMREKKAHISNGFSLFWKVKTETIKVFYSCKIYNRVYLSLLTFSLDNYVFFFFI